MISTKTTATWRSSPPSCGHVPLGGRGDFATHVTAEQVAHALALAQAVTIELNPRCSSPSSVPSNTTRSPRRSPSSTRLSAARTTRTGVAVSQARIHIKTKPKISAARRYHQDRDRQLRLAQIVAASADQNAVSTMPSTGTPEPEQPHRQRPAHDAGCQPPRRLPGLQRLGGHRTQRELGEQITRGGHQNAGEADAEAHDRDEVLSANP